MNPVPETGTVGKYFAGMMDELRFSNIVRKSFNVPNNDSRTIEFLALNNASSTAKSFPQVQIALNSDSGVDPSKIKVFLNGSEQVADENLTITANTIEGQLNEPIKLGVNYLSVEFVDNGNVQKKKTTYFFGVEHKPLSYLSTDPNTKGLYHFERFNKFTDSSGNNNHLTGTENEVEGVLGKGQAGAANLPVFQMGSRSFTLEAYVKGNSSYSSMMQLFKLQGTEFNFRFSVNPETGEIYYYLNTPDMNLSKTVQGAFPTDKEFHHVSAVYDASRAHAQLLIFVDGKIVQANDINRSCDFSGDISFSVGTTYLDVDEARIKNDADYSYSLKDSVSSPSITLVGLSEEETITTPTREIEIQLNSSVGINNLGNKVLLNSQEVQGLNFSQTGQTATLTGNLSGYVGGANILEVISRDVDGRENIDSMLFYYFASSNTGEYNSDEDTYVLLHFNETSGNYVSDVSQYGHDFSFSSGWTLDTEGMFGTSGASTYSTSLNSTLSDLTGVGAYTIEMWKKDTSGTSAELFKLGSLQLRKSSGKLYFYAPSGGPAISTTESFSYDGQFHHYAVVVDLEHEFRNVYLLRDGVVVKSEKLSDLEGHRLSNATDARMGSYFYGDSVDEFRFSTRARYILNSAKN